MAKKFANADLTAYSGAPLFQQEAQRKALRRGVEAFSMPYTPYSEPTIAEFNKYHRQANTRLLNELARRQGSDEVELSKQELDAASGIRSHHKARDLLKGYLDNPQELQKKFYNPYAENRFKAMEKEADKTWFEKIQPTLTGQAIANGTFGSPAYKKHMERVARDFRLNLKRQQSEFKHAGAESAMRGASEHTNTAARHAEVAGQMAAQDRAGHIGMANARLDTAGKSTSQEIAMADALREEANRHQTQEQRELSEGQRRFQEEIEHPQRMAREFASLVAGQPQLASNVQQHIPYPQIPPTNATTVAAGALNAAFAPMAPRPQKTGGRTYKNGGAVRKLAAGGPGSPYELSDAQLPSMNSPEMIAGKRLAHNFGHDSRSSPVGAYMSHLGANLLANETGRPLEALGKGIKEGYQAHEAAHESNNVNKVRQANLLGAITDSRLKQQNLLAEYQMHRMGHEETSRHNKAMEAHSGTAAQAAMLKAEAYKAASEQKTETGLSSKRYLYDQEGKVIGPRTTDDNKHIHGLMKAIKDRKNAADLLIDAGEKSQQAESGYWKGWAADPNAWINRKMPIGQGLLDTFTKDLEPLQKAGTASDKYALGVSAINSGRQTVHGLKSIQAAKLNPRLSKAANLESSQDDLKHQIQGSEEELNMLRLSGATPEEIAEAMKDTEELKSHAAHYNQKMGSSKAAPPPSEGQPDVDLTKMSREELQAIAGPQ